MEDIRLDTNCKPLHYDIFLDFDIDDYSYSGEVQIDMEFINPSNSFTIHSEAPVEILEITDQDSQVLSYTVRPYSILKVLLKNEVSGKFSVKFTFRARIHEVHKGCYVCNSDTEKMVISHFEPNYGRMALPCFDEPGIKSIFDLKIRVDPNYKVVSNMPGIYNPEQNLHIFTTSPLMSLYLLHWTICKHEKISTLLDSTLISIYTRYPEKSSIFLDLAKDCLEYFNNLFGIPYPLPKLDLIAVFRMSVRAMENWGSITFLENILVKNDWETFEKFFRDCRTVCHEISHMWFGNLVTMDWWTDLWLNEGFARFMEFKCLEKIRPEFDPWSKFISQVLYIALNIDTPIAKSHPVEIVCLDPDDIGSYFDNISYLKGASILRMMENLMDSDFNTGVISYLTNHKYKSVTSDIFFDCMQSFTSIKVKSIIRTWTKQPGFPLITVRKEAYGIFRVSQKPFDENQDALWIVPIRYLTETGETGLFILDKEEDIIEAPGSWIKLNHRSVGFYRVLYINYQELFENIQTLTTEDRFGLLHDSLTFYKSGKIDFEYHCKLLTCLSPESSFIVLNLISSLPTKSTIILEKELYEQVLKESSLALWDKYHMDLPENNLEFPLIQTIFLHFLIFDLAEEQVLRTIAESHPDFKYYEECLMILFGIDESTIVENPNALHNILVYSKKTDTLRAAVRKNFELLNTFPEKVEKFTKWAYYRTGENELLQIVFDIIVESENEPVVQALAKILIIIGPGNSTQRNESLSLSAQQAFDHIKSFENLQDIAGSFEKMFQL